MPIAEEKALEILAELIKKPDSKVEDIPRIWNEIMTVYNTQFAPPVEPPAKKRRRRSINPNIGWPAGVKREEYKAWKMLQESRGVTENLNPQEYKRQRDLGILNVASANGSEPRGQKKATVAAVKAPPKAPVKPVAKKPARAK